MYCTKFSRLAGFVMCATVAIAAIQRPAAAAEKETQTVTFALYISAAFGDEISVVGEDTIGIHFGKLLSPTSTLTFAAGSPACEGFEVAGTEWNQQLFDRMMILNKGGPSAASVFTMGAQIPEHSLLRVADITDLRVCWIKENGSGGAVVQEEGFDGDTVAALFIVTGEFPVRN